MPEARGLVASHSHRRPETVRTNGPFSLKRILTLCEGERAFAGGLPTPMGA